MVVLRAVARRELRFDEVTIDVGDQVVQYFPRKEWFYIQEYLAPSGAVKGWYCNIATPPSVEGSTITTQDLIVDLFAWPDRKYKVLDLDELEERKGPLRPSTTEKVYEARDRLVRIIERREPPFDRQGRAHL